MFLNRSSRKLNYLTRTKVGPRTTLKKRENIIVQASRRVTTPPPIVCYEVIPGQFVVQAIFEIISAAAAASSQSSSSDATRSSLFRIFMIFMKTALGVYNHSFHSTYILQLNLAMERVCRKLYPDNDHLRLRKIESKIKQARIIPFSYIAVIYILLTAKTKTVAKTVKHHHQRRIFDVIVKVVGGGGSRRAVGGGSRRAVGGGSRRAVGMNKTTGGAGEGADYDDSIYPDDSDFLVDNDPRDELRFDEEIYLSLPTTDRTKLILDKFADSAKLFDLGMYRAELQSLTSVLSAESVYDIFTEISAHTDLKSSRLQNMLRHYLSEPQDDANIKKYFSNYQYHSNTIITLTCLAYFQKHLPDAYFFAHNLRQTKSGFLECRNVLRFDEGRKCPKEKFVELARALLISIDDFCQADTGDQTIFFIPVFIPHHAMLMLFNKKTRSLEMYDPDMRANPYHLSMLTMSKIKIADDTDEFFLEDFMEMCIDDYNQAQESPDLFIKYISLENLRLRCESYSSIKNEMFDWNSTDNNVYKESGYCQLWCLYIMKSYFASPPSPAEGTVSIFKLLKNIAKDFVSVYRNDVVYISKLIRGFHRIFKITMKEELGFELKFDEGLIYFPINQQHTDKQHSRYYEIAAEHPGPISDKLKRVADYIIDNHRAIDYYIPTPSSSQASSPSSSQASSPESSQLSVSTLSSTATAAPPHYSSYLKTFQLYFSYCLSPSQQFMNLGKICINNMSPNDDMSTSSNDDNDDPNDKKFLLVIENTSYFFRSADIRLERKLKPNKFANGSGGNSVYLRYKLECRKHWCAPLSQQGVFTMKYVPSYNLLIVQNANKKIIAFTRMQEPEIRYNKHRNVNICIVYRAFSGEIFYKQYLKQQNTYERAERKSNR